MTQQRKQPSTSTVHQRRQTDGSYKYPAVLVLVPRDSHPILLASLCFSLYGVLNLVHPPSRVSQRCWPRAPAIISSGVWVQRCVRLAFPARSYIRTSVEFALVRDGLRSLSSGQEGLSPERKPVSGLDDVTLPCCLVVATARRASAACRVQRKR